MLLGASVAHADEPPPIKRIAPPSETALSANEINKTMQANQPAFRRCFQRAQKRPSYVGVRLVYRLEIGGDGKVESAFRVRPTKGSNMLDTCISDAIKRVVFRASGTKSTVNYPFNATKP